MDVKAANDLAAADLNEYMYRLTVHLPVAKPLVTDERRDHGELEDSGGTSGTDTRRDGAMRNLGLRAMHRRPTWPGLSETGNRVSERRVHDAAAVVLVVVLVVVAVLALAAYAFHDVMMAENEVTQMVGRQIQAYSLAASGVANLQVFPHAGCRDPVGSRRAVRQCGPGFRP